MNALALFLDYQIRKSLIFKSSVIYNKSLPENLIMGSSRSLTGIDSKLLSEITSKTWYNLSIDDTPIETHLLMYKWLVAMNKTPKNLILQYDKSGNSKVLEKQIHEKDYQFMPFYLQSNNVIPDHIAEKTDVIHSFLYALPFYKYTTFNTELVFSAIQASLNNTKHHRFDGNGDYSYPIDFPQSKSNCDGIKIISLDFEHPSFMEFVALCKENSTNLFVYVAPFKCLKVGDASEKNENFQFLNLSGVMPRNSYFLDEQHINNDGKSVITHQIGDVILKNQYFVREIKKQGI